MGGFNYKQWDDRIIEKMYLDQPIEDIAFILDRSAGSVYKRAADIGAKRSPEYAEKIRAKTNKLLEKAGAKTRLQLGSISWNKGLRQADYMSAENIAKTARSRFKTGQTPHNTKPIGSVRMNKDGMYELKVAENSKNKNFRHLHRLIYEKLHGALSPGMVVVFLDFNTKNFAHDNLAALTRAEHLQRNRLSDSAIVKKLIKTSNKDEIIQFTYYYQELINMKRQALLINQTIGYARKN